MNWFYAIKDERLGPVREEALRQLRAAGTIGDDTLVWREGMAGWQPLRHVGLDTGAAAPAPESGPLFQAPERTPAGEGREEPIEFTGSAGEYFRIWIVNLGLTILTLGIYAAWAKVRKKRYFYGNTLLGGKAFEYTGNPIAILKGNLLIGGVLLAYSAVSAVLPPLTLLFIVAFAIGFPWLYWKALRFNAHNTRHRNIRFHFHGTLGESYGINLGLPIAIPFTLGFIWPYIQFRKRQYQLGNLSYGSARFRFDGQIGPFYGIFFKAIGVILLIALLVGFIGGAVTQLAGGVQTLGPDSFIIVGGVVYAVMLLLGPIYYHTRATNYAVSCTTVPPLATLRSSMRVREVLWLEFTNLLAIVFTLGLAIPWAAIRRARYRFGHLHVALARPLDEVAATMETSQSAIGDSAADVLDFDIAL